MNNKEFISELSRKLGYTNKDTSQLVSSVIGVMTQELQDGNNIAIQGFGTFEVKKKLERISIICQLCRRQGEALCGAH